MNTHFEIKTRTALNEWGWDIETEEGLLLLLELMVKVQNGYYISYTELGFLESMNVLTKAKVPNSKGKTFMCHMLSASCNHRPPAFELMEKYRSKH